MGHDFKKYPELSNNQMQYYYFESPHRQITEDFTARVSRVHDGDTVTLNWEGRDFDFPMRIDIINAPELDQEGGIVSKAWLESQVLGKECQIILNPARIEKWGRLLGKLICDGMDIGEQSLNQGFSVVFEDDTGTIPEVKWP